MQTRYAVHFEVEQDGVDSSDVHRAVTEQVRLWWLRLHEDAPTLASIWDNPGDMSAARRNNAATVTHSQMSWDSVSIGGAITTRQSLRTPAGSLWVVTNVTAHSRPDDAAAHVRIALSTEIPDQRLAPNELPFLNRPGIVRALVSDPDLVVRQDGRLVDDRYTHLKDAHEGEALARALSTSERLPVVVVAAWQYPDDLTASRKTAGALSGLAQVFVVTGNARRRFNGLMGDLGVTPGDARLFWSDISHDDQPTLKRFSEQAEPLSDTLFDRLAPISATVDPLDRLWADAQRVVQEAEVARLNSLASSADTAIEILRDNLRKANNQAEEWFNAAQKEESRAASAEADLEAARRDIARLEWYRHQYQGAPQGGVTTDLHADTDGWSDAPDLQPNDGKPLFDYLEQASNGRITFLPQASRSWRKCNYPDPERMRDALVSLSRASVQYWTNGGDVGENRVEWFYLEHGLVLVLTDRTLDKKVAEETRDGAILKFYPHIKLGDATIASSVGRIYFAFDKPGERLVVKHVGVHDFALTSNTSK